MRHFWAGPNRSELDECLGVGRCVGILRRAAGSQNLARFPRARKHEE